MTEPRLPPELWISIFRYATVTHLTPSLSTTIYTPFLPTTEGITDKSLKVKCTINRVCRLWRNLAIDLLYEDVLVLNEHVQDLRRVLEGQADGENEHTRRVRRLCMPYSSSVPQMASAYPTDALSILRACPSLEVLARPNPVYGSRGEAQLFEYPAEPCPPLTSLKRLDWWHRNDAARTGGINCLIDVLQAAPNITYLSIEGEMGLSLMQLASIIELNALTTIHLRRVNTLFILQISKWHLPSLQHVILDGYTNVHMLQSIARSFGSQMRTLELGKSLKFLISDSLHPVLDACSALKELNYYVFFTRPPSVSPEPHPSLTTVRLHSAINLLLLENDDSYWSHINLHFAAFCSPSFPALKRVLLHGSWSFILDHPQCLPSMQKLIQRGCSVEEVCY